MPYTVNFLENKEIVLVKNEGELGFADYEKQTREALDLAKTRDYHLFVSDCRLLINKASVAELFHFPEMFARLNPLRNNKLAVLVEKDAPDIEDYHFVEDVLINRGRIARIFDDYNQALTWLSPVENR